jgi:hypothetical protein
MPLELKSPIKQSIPYEDNVQPCLLHTCSVSTSLRQDPGKVHFFLKNLFFSWRKALYLWFFKKYIKEKIDNFSIAPIAYRKTNHRGHKKPQQFKASSFLAFINHKKNNLEAF